VTPAVTTAAAASQIGQEARARRPTRPSSARLAAQKEGGPPRKLVGFEVLGRGIARHGHPVQIGERVVGAVTSGTYAPFLKKNIGLCYLPAAKTAVGTEFDVDIRGQRVPARVVPTPFYKRAK